MPRPPPPESLDETLAIKGTLIDEVRQSIRLKHVDRRTNQMSSVAALHGEVAVGFASDPAGLAPILPEGTDSFVAVTLPPIASGVMRFRESLSGFAIDVRLADATDAPAQQIAGYLVYRGGHANGADVIHAPTGQGNEDYFYFRSSPKRETVQYSIALGDGVAGLRQVSDSLELVDKSGTPRLRVSPPYLVGSDGEQYWADLSLQGCAADHNPSGPWGRSVTPPGAPTCTLTIDWTDKHVPYPALLDPAWSNSTNTMTNAHVGAVATVVDGYVLVVGGSSGWKHAELYNPSLNSWATTGDLATGQMRGSAAIANTAANQALIIGGWGQTDPKTTEEFCHGTCSWTSGTWRTRASMGQGRELHTATVLSNGKILVTGGQDPANSNFLNTAEIYDPSGNSWANVTASMVYARSAHSGTSLLNGNFVLLAGGDNNDSPATALNGAEVFAYNSGAPGSSTFHQTGDFGGGKQHYYHHDMVLRGGKVLVAGAPNDDSAHIYSPGDFSSTWGTWTATSTPMINKRYSGAGVAVPGAGLLIGGIGNSYVTQSAAELYDPINDAFVATASLGTARDFFTGTLLPDGVHVLVAGGEDATQTALTSSQVYNRVDANGILSCDGTHPDLFCAYSKCSSGNKCCTDTCECGTCASTGTCSTPRFGLRGSPSCGAYLCNGTSTSCPTTCGNSSPCDAGNYCTAGACLPCQATSAVTTESFSALGDDTAHYAVEVRNVSAKAGSFFGTAYPDVVLADDSSRTIQVYAGTSGGISSTATPSTFGTADFGSLLQSDGFLALAVGDMNGDGFADVVVTQYHSGTGASYVYVIPNVSTGMTRALGTASATALTSYGNPVDVALGDLDGDGDLDVVVGLKASTRTFATLRNDGSGSLTALTDTTYPDSTAPPGRIALADFDQDGKLDLAAGAAFTPGGQGVWVMPGNGDCTFVTSTNQMASAYANTAPEPDLGTTSVVDFLAVGDFDGDTKPDLAYIDNGAFHSATATPYREVLVCRNTTTTAKKPNFANCVTVAANQSSLNNKYFAALSIADFNNDGKSDLAAALGEYIPRLNSGDSSNTNGVVTVYYGYSGGAFSNIQLSSTQVDPRTLVAADYSPNDCKSLPDLITIHGSWPNNFTLDFAVNDFQNTSN